MSKLVDVDRILDNETRSRDGLAVRVQRIVHTFMSLRYGPTEVNPSKSDILHQSPTFITITLKCNESLKTGIC